MEHNDYDIMAQSFDFWLRKIGLCTQNEFIDMKSRFKISNGDSYFLFSEKPDSGNNQKIETKLL